jgi:hypothetical protein
MHMYKGFEGCKKTEDFFITLCYNLFTTTNLDKGEILVSFLCYYSIDLSILYQLGRKKSISKYPLR